MNSGNTVLKRKRDDNDPSVVASSLTGFSLSSTAATANQILVSNGTQWAPSSTATLSSVILTGNGNGTNRTLSYYETTTLSETVSGPFANGSTTLYIQKIGQHSTVFFPGFTAGGNSVSATISFSAAIPARFLPQAPVSGFTKPILVYSNAVAYMGYVAIDTTLGTISVYAPASAATTAIGNGKFAASAGLTGFDAFTVDFI